MTGSDTDSRATQKAATPLGGEMRAGILGSLSQLASELNTAETPAEAHHIALRTLSHLIPYDSIRVTAASGADHQQLCATFERGGFASVAGGERESFAHTMLERACESRAPDIYNRAQTELASGALLLSLVCHDAQSVLCAPLTLGGAATGLIIASTAHADSYTQTDAAIAGLTAGLLASSLARISLSAHVTGAEEREHARRREEALVEQVGLAARSSFDLEQIIQRAIDALARALPASFVVLRTVTFGRPDQLIRAWTPGDDRPPLELHVPVSQEERAVYTEQRAVFIEDARTQRGLSNELRPLVERLGARSIRLAPVIYGGQALAAIGLIESDKERVWTQDEQLLLARVAETIAPLLLNAQLHARSRSYIEDLLALLRLAGAVSSEAEMDHALRAVLEAWSRIAGTDSNAVLRWDEEAQLFRLAIAEHLPTGLLERYTQGVPLSDPICGLAASRRIGVAADLAGDARFAELYGAVRWSGLRGMWATPIIGRANQVLGLLISFTRAATEVAPEEQRLADLFARPAGIALQNLEAYRKQRTLSAQAAQLEEQTRRAEQYKMEFMAIISHELRTPLNAIIGYAQMLIDGFSGALTDAQRVDVQTISDSADRLLSMVEDALDLARMDEQRFPVFMDTVAFDDVVRRAVATVIAEAEKKGLHVKTQIAESVPVVRTDPERVRQILSNLLSNAVKFTERGSIHISVERDELGGVRFNVTDTGIGFDTAAFPHIFEDLRQLDASTTRIYGGTGLGLAVSKRLVQRLGGQIGVTSTPGEGSTFWFRLPLEIPGAEG
ncbi:MAG: GAF domain-containing protein [Acidobacteria bacterium]|nr:GAF domain-containing protein [Acidobacteriota bacterium]